MSCHHLIRKEKRNFIFNVFICSKKKKRFLWWNFLLLIPLKCIWLWTKAAKEVLCIQKTKFTFNFAWQILNFFLLSILTQLKKTPLASFNSNDWCTLFSILSRKERDSLIGSWNIEIWLTTIQSPIQVFFGHFRSEGAHTYSSWYLSGLRFQRRAP